MKKTGGLGRGLGALIEDLPALDATDTLCQLPVRDIDPNQNQPRRHFEEEALKRLADSIKASGVIQPIVVRKEGMRYMIITGERRWRASRLAGLDTIPAIVRDVDRQTLYEMALVENMQREDLDPVEEARALNSYLQDYGLTQEQAAARLGMSRPALANSVRLLQLPDEILDLLSGGKLSMGHARCLLGIQDGQRQLEIARRIVKDELSVRQAEALAKQEKAVIKTHKPPVPADEGLVELGTSMRRLFGTKVQVTGTPDKGSIRIDYYSREDIERIYELIQRMQ